MKYFLGIDPGLSGALALIDENATVIGLSSLPVVEVATTKKTKGGKKRIKRDYDHAKLMRFLGDIAVNAKGACNVTVILEQQSPRPGESAMGAYSLGNSFGFLHGTVRTMQFPVERPYPATWHRVMMPGALKALDPKLKKKAIMLKAAELYPQAVARMQGPRGGDKDGVADALLLATYGLRLAFYGDTMGVRPVGFDD